MNETVVKVYDPDRVPAMNFWDKFGTAQRRKIHDLVCIGGECDAKETPYKEFNDVYNMYKTQEKDNYPSFENYVKFLDLLIKNPERKPSSFQEEVEKMRRNLQDKGLSGGKKKRTKRRRVKSRRRRSSRRRR